MASLTQILNHLGFDGDVCFQLAVKHRFKSRRRGLCASYFVVALLDACTSHVVSFNILASAIASQFRIIVSKQAVHKALSSAAFSAFFDEFFSLFVAKKLCQQEFTQAFNRIIIQDSTIIKLPMRLFSLFSGVKNQFVQVTNARIQLALSLGNHSLTHFSLDSYSKSDMSAAKELPIEKGNLVLRDRGYFSVDEIKRLHSVSAFYIYRNKANMNYYCAATGQKIHLLKMLNRYKAIDMTVKINSADGPQVRIVAQPVSQQIAEERRRKARKENRCSPSQENLALMGWTIFVTNIFDKKYSFEQILRLYGIRWNIELVFKSLKSEINFDKIHNVSASQLRFIVQARIIRLLLVFQFALAINQLHQNSKNEQPGYSNIKLVQVLINDPCMLVQFWTEYFETNNLSEFSYKYLQKYCSYDTRNRENALDNFLMELS